MRLIPTKVSIARCDASMAMLAEETDESESDVVVYGLVR